MANLDLPNFSEPIEGVYCAGQPSAEQFQAAAEAGVTTVVNLRPAGETAPRDIEAEVTGAGMTYVNIPIGGPGDLDKGAANALAEALDAAEGGVLIHCGSSNRVGGLLALKAHWVDGVPAAEALALGRAAGLTGLEPMVASLLG